MYPLAQLLLIATANAVVISHRLKVRRELMEKTDKHHIEALEGSIHARLRDALVKLSVLHEFTKYMECVVGEQTLQLLSELFHSSICCY